jgi:Tol biopolymer transport system component
MASRRDKVAFIGSDKNLWVVDVEGHNLQRLSEEAAPYEEPLCPRNVLITGWTPDDAKILYHVESEGEMCTLRTDVALGFYIIDLESGAKTHLPELPNFIAWLDTERVIFEEESSPYTEWYTFDTRTGEAQKFAKLPFECFHPEASLSYSDNTMVYECSSVDEGSSIVHANIDNTEQTVLLEGRWAELQHPRVSPNGKAFVFERERPLGGGLYAQDLYHYDLASGGETLLMSGFTSFQEWLDDTRVVVLESTESLLGGPSTLYVVDVISGDRTALAEDVDFY